MKAHWQMFAGYNAWANARIYDHAAQLSNEDHRADRGAFFKSVHGALNHLLVTDRIWMRRCTGAGEVPDRLDAILFESLAELRGRGQRKMPASSLSSRAWTKPRSHAAFAIGRSRRRRNSSRSFGWRWRIGSTIRRIIAARSTACSHALPVRRRNSIFSPISGRLVQADSVGSRERSARSAAGPDGSEMAMAGVELSALI